MFFSLLVLVVLVFCVELRGKDRFAFEHNATQASHMQTVQYEEENEEEERESERE